MKELIQQLEEWQDNINNDISAVWNDHKDNDARQSIAISMAIGLLKGVGDNNNIPE